MGERDKENKYLSVLMQEIDKFVRTYGVDKLITYLGDYHKDIALEEFNKYQKIEKISCEIWDLPIADLVVRNLGGKNKSVRMTIAYLTHQYTNINRQQLSLMMKANLRTIHGYLSDIEYRIEHESQYPIFCENLEIIKDKTDCE